MTSQTPPDPERQIKATPGWYPDPTMVNTQRYWDGERWTDTAAPLAVAADATPAPFNNALEAVGWLGALFFPIIGIIIGIIMAVKGHVRGVPMILIAVLFGSYWFFQFADHGTI